MACCFISSLLDKLQQDGEKGEELKYRTRTASQGSGEQKGNRSSWMCLEEVLLAGKAYQQKTAQVEYQEVLFQDNGVS